MSMVKENLPSVLHLPRQDSIVLFGPARARPHHRQDAVGGDCRFARNEVLLAMLVMFDEADVDEERWGSKCAAVQFGDGACELLLLAGV